MYRKGIGPQGLGTSKNNGYTIGEAKGGCKCKGMCQCGKSPMKKLKDLSGDGKVTQKDVLIGRGVLGSPAKQMIKRADGSTSKRGLWDNIRANKGSGKKPTKEMLKEAKKIKNK
jgi:hypothetical protein